MALIGKASLALIVSPRLNVKTMADFVQLVKSKPKAINFGSGVFAPASTPADVVTSLNDEINRALQQADVQKRLADFGLVPTPVRPADLDKLIQQDLKRFGPLVKSLGLTAS